MGKFAFGLGMGVGYVLGAQAGRGRYEQIKQAASGLVERPEVQQALEKARTAAPAPLQSSIEKLSRQASGDQSAGAADARTAVPEEVDVDSTPPVPDVGGPTRADGPLPDPLIPPAKSNGSTERP